MSVRKRILAGVGNAGVTLADLLAVSRPGERDLVAINNDGESLGASVAPASILLPSGDPGEALASVAGRFGETLEGASALFLFGALGGRPVRISCLASRSKPSPAAFPSIAASEFPSRSREASGVRDPARPSSV